MSDYFEIPQVDTNGIYHYRGVMIYESSQPYKYYKTRLFVGVYDKEEKAIPEVDCPHFNCVAHAVKWIDNLMDSEATRDNVKETPGQIDHPEN